MVTGLVLSAVVNVCFGFSSAVVALGMLLDDQRLVPGHGVSAMRAGIHALGAAQGAGDQDVHLERLDQHRRGHGVGDLRLPAQVVSANWRLCFLVPAAIAFLCSVFLWFALPDTPQSVGLPEVEGTKSKAVAGESEDWMAVAVKYVFSNPYIWLLAVANFFVYTIRYAMVDWGPTLLTQAKGLQLTNAGWMVAGYEISGMVGALIAGWLTDRFFGGRGFRSCVFYMAMAGVSVLLFWKVAGEIGHAQHAAALRSRVSSFMARNA